MKEKKLIAVWISEEAMQMVNNEKAHYREAAADALDRLLGVKTNDKQNERGEPE